MSFMESMKLVIAYMLLSWHYLTINHTPHYMSIFCLIGEYRIQTYLSSDFFPSITDCVVYHVSLKMYADEYVTGY